MASSPVSSPEQKKATTKTTTTKPSTKTTSKPSTRTSTKPKKIKKKTKKEEVQPRSRQQRHTFTVTREEVARGEHSVAVVWLLKEIPTARRLEIRFFTGDDREMSLEFTWSSGETIEDSVSRSVDIEVTEEQAVPLGATLLCMIAESAKNLKELKIYTGLERVDELQLSKLLGAFALTGHWETTLEKLEINFSCIENGTFSRLPCFPTNVRTVILDSCMVMEENELEEFLSHLPKLESFQVIGNSKEDDINTHLIEF